MDMRTKNSRGLFGWCHRMASSAVLVSTCWLLLVSSCSSVGRYTPEPSLAEGVAGNLSSRNSVAVVNAQDSREEHAMDFRGIVVDYHEFTQSVVDALKAELARNGVTVRDQADKTLRIAVKKVTMMPGPATFRGAINATVETGSGQVEKFYATRASYASGWNVGTNPTKPLASAFRDLVASILANDEVQQYLAN